jgi:hypothetical protein
VRAQVTCHSGEERDKERFADWDLRPREKRTLGWRDHPDLKPAPLRLRAVFTPLVGSSAGAAILPSERAWTIDVPDSPPAWHATALVFVTPKASCSTTTPRARSVPRQIFKQAAKMRSATPANALSVRMVGFGSPERNPQGWPRTLDATALELSAALLRNLRLVNRRGGARVRSLSLPRQRFGGLPRGERWIYFPSTKTSIVWLAGDAATVNSLRRTVRPPCPASIV